MELRQDWRAFQSMFYPQKRSTQQPVESLADPVYLVVANDRIVSNYSNYEDFSAWIGANYTELAAQYPNRDFILFEREKVDKWMATAASLSSYHEHVEHLKGESTGQVFAKNSLSKPTKPPLLSSGANALGRKHFVLDALQGWWAKVLPAKYAIFMRIIGDEAAGESTDELMIVIRKGTLIGFHEPDLSPMPPERRKDLGEVVKFLSGTYLLKVQAVSVLQSEWLEWNVAANPWRRMALALKANKAKLVPFKWIFVGLASARALLGV